MAGRSAPRRAPATRLQARRRRAGGCVLRPYEGHPPQHTAQPQWPGLRPGRDEAVADLCIEHDVIAICDEVYEEITFGPEHIRLATLPGMEERTVTLSSVGKTYSLTGEGGWAIALIISPRVCGRPTNT